VPQRTIDNILRAADRAAFVVMSASLHGCADVVNHLGARNGSVNGGGITQIAEEDLDVAIVHELRRRLPSNQEANALPFLQ
jgi:hypothetical protein